MIKVTAIDGSYKSDLYINKSDIYSMVRYEEENKTVLFRKHDKSIKVLQTPEEILAAHDIEPPKNIDWEQRRYEIAKDILAATNSRLTVHGSLLNINMVLNAADALIKELQKQQGYKD